MSTLRPARIIRPPVQRTPTRLAIFVRDALKRSSWGCPRALLHFAIASANGALLARFGARP